MKFIQSDSDAKRNAIIFIIAQATMGSQMPMIFILGGLAGQSLAENICYATLPISMIVLGSMLTAPVLSQVMQKYGRKAGFLLGAFGGAIGATIGALGLYYQSFPLFLFGSLFTGVYMSAQGFYRFAALDTASDALRPKVISYVLAGGLLAAVIGPQLVKVTAHALVVPYLATYLAVIALNVFGSVVFLFLAPPVPDTEYQEVGISRTRWQLLQDPKILISMFCAMVSYALMNLMMTSTPLAVVGCGFDENRAADVVSAHVLAMFLPSFFTGHLIAKYGAERIIGIGLVLLTISAFAGLSGVDLGNFFAALILLGLGWNFGFIGATTLLANSYAPSERAKVQGLNDFLVFGSVTAASFGSGWLMNCSGSSVVKGWSSVNIAMLPWLLLAAIALLWLYRQKISKPVHS
ncbi:MAG: MFS transporter [Paracoccaceae bacterium]|jgi:MFS family permease|nr:MFS transporter [Paracoccaceae bacterium]MDA0320824.1 MFS transporter [Pseudomonadota bacterium]MDA0851433.1 MFS transporter [Pseudomonadota bacterium]MDA1295444.1 MFS transporter [Pseudomonadota bacterium]